MKTTTTMKTIALEVNDDMEKSYQGLSTDNKRAFEEEVNLILKKFLTEARSIKIKTMLAELKNEEVYGDLDPEVLGAIVRTEDY